MPCSGLIWAQSLRVALSSAPETPGPDQRQWSERASPSCHHPHGCQLQGLTPHSPHVHGSPGPLGLGAALKALCTPRAGCMGLTPHSPHVHGSPGPLGLGAALKALCTPGAGCMGLTPCSPRVHGGPGPLGLGAALKALCTPRPGSTARVWPWATGCFPGGLWLVSDTGPRGGRVPKGSPAGGCVRRASAASHPPARG